MTDQLASLTARTGADWERWLSRNTKRGDDGVTLAKTPALTERPLGFHARDIDLNPNGNLTVLTDEGAVAIYVADDGNIKPLTLTGFDDVGFRTPTLVATSSETLGVIGANGRVGGFSRRLRHLDWTDDRLTDPVAAVGSPRRLYVLDRDETGGSVHSFDHDGEATVEFEGVGSPLDLTVAADETLFVLVSGSAGPQLLAATATVGRFDGGLTTVELSLPAGFTATNVAAQTTTELILSGTDENGRPTLLRYDIETGSISARSTRNGDWTGLVSGTVGDSGTENRFFLRSAADGTVTSFHEGRKNRKDPENTRYEGRLIGRFDSGERDTQWHRVTAEVAQSEPGNRIDIQYYASECETAGVDDLTALSLTDEQGTALEAAGVTGLWDLIEYTPATLANTVSSVTTETAAAWLERARRTLESTFEERPDAHSVTDPRDVLLTEASGRYLHVLVRFVGSRESTPRLRSLRAYCPRQSYLRYLPEIYQQAGSGSSFLERFLSIFETTLVDIEADLDATSRYLDAQEIPTAYLSWLNGWLALDLGETWSESARRELLARAPELYKLRGTRQGLLALIELYLDHVTVPDPPGSRSLVRIERQLDRLVERDFLTESEAERQRRQYASALATDDTSEIVLAEYQSLDCVTDQAIRERYERLFGHPRRFQLLCHPTLPAKHVRAIQQIAESEKPLYTDVRAEQLQRRFQLGGTYLGMNTHLPDRQFAVGHSVLGAETTVDHHTHQP